MASTALGSCWKELENVLLPVNVGAVIELVLEPMDGSYATVGRTREGPAHRVYLRLLSSLLLQELENCLRRGIGLGHGGNGSLLQHLGLGEIGRFACDIGVADLGLRRGEVGDLGIGQTDGVVRSFRRRPQRPAQSRGS